MSLIIKLQQLYAKYCSDNLADNLDYRKLDGLSDILNYVALLPEPRDDIQRSLNHYRGTVKHLNRFKRLLINVTALFLIPLYLLKLRALKDNEEPLLSCDGIFFVADHISESIIPNSLKTEYKKIIRVNPESGCSLSGDDRVFFWKVVRGTFGHPFFHLKVLIKLGFLADVLRKFNVKAVIHNTESSFATSILTLYCEKKGINYIGVMHGEFFANYKMSFFRCSRYYVWDQEYKDLLLSERCYSDQFEVEQPECLFLSDFNPDCKKKFDLTYYLQNESESELISLKKILNELKLSGKSISLRVHPKYYSEELFRKVFNQEWMNIIETCSLDYSLSQTKAVVAKCSTILYQAYLQGIPVVIDDITNPQLFSYLQRVNYLMLNKKHEQLSNYLKVAKND